MFLLCKRRILAAGDADAVLDVAVGSSCLPSTSAAVSTGVLLVTELIRLTLKKLQSALEDNRISDEDLVAMAMAVDAGAVSAALQNVRHFYTPAHLL